MAKERKYHSVPDQGEWAIRLEQSSRAIRRFSSQREAEAFGKQLAENQGTNLIPHDRKGRFKKK